MTICLSCRADFDGRRRTCPSCGTARLRLPKQAGLNQATVPERRTTPSTIDRGPDRAPGPFCEVCGSAPAVAASFHDVTGMLILFRLGTRKGTFCHDCGTSIFRTSTNRTLLLGWFGVISFFLTWAMLISNLAAARKVKALEARGHRMDGPGVPLAVGKPLHRRAGLWVAPAILIVLLVVGVTAGSTPTPDGAGAFDHKCLRISDDRITDGPLDCSEPNDGQVIATPTDPSLCPSQTDIYFTAEADERVLCVDLVGVAPPPGEIASDI